MIGKTITAPDITIRSAAMAALLTQAVLAAGMKEVLVVDMAAALAVGMVEASAVEATAVAEHIAKCGETLHLGKRNHA